jgi:hypothetical protein
MIPPNLGLTNLGLLFERRLLLEPYSLFLGEGGGGGGGGEYVGVVEPAGESTIIIS